MSQIPIVHEKARTNAERQLGVLGYLGSISQPQVSALCAHVRIDKALIDRDDSFPVL